MLITGIAVFSACLCDCGVELHFNDRRGSLRLSSGLMPQVWANCRAYNPEGTIVRQMGDRLSDTWEKKWYQQGVEAKWEGLMRELKEEEVRAHVVTAVP